MSVSALRKVPCSLLFACKLFGGQLKKFLSCLLAGLLALSLCACAGGNGTGGGGIFRRPLCRFLYNENPAIVAGFKGG